MFTDFLDKNNIRRYSRYTPETSLLVDRFNRDIGNFLKKPSNDKVYGNWIDELNAKKVFFAS